jgi:hypothetical protein
VWQAQHFKSSFKTFETGFCGTAYHSPVSKKLRCFIFSDFFLKYCEISEKWLLCGPLKTIFMFKNYGFLKSKINHYGTEPKSH